MNQKLSLLILFFLQVFIVAQVNNLAPSKVSIDEYFGIKVLDEYRNLENLNDLSTSDWMKSQTQYSLSVLKNIPNRNFYINKRIEFEKRKSFSVNNIIVTKNDLHFYLKKKVMMY